MSNRVKAKKATKPKPVAQPVEAPELATLEEATAELAEALSADLAEGGSGINEDGSFRPIEIGKRGRPGVEMVHIFTVDGIKYSIPKQPHRLMLLRYLSAVRQARNEAERDAATMEVLLKLLGRRAIDALEESSETTDEDVADVLSYATIILMGAVAKLSSQPGGASGN